MAANFQKTFEFKVKSQDLDRAVKKLFKEIKNVELSVKEVNKGTRLLTKELKTATKEAGGLGRALEKVSKAGKGFLDLDAKAKKLLGNLLKLGKTGIVVDVLGKSVVELTKRFIAADSGIRKASGALIQWGKNAAGLIITHGQLVQSLGSVGIALAAVGRFAPAIYDLGKGFRQLVYDVNRALKAIVEYKSVSAGVFNFTSKGKGAQTGAGSPFAGQEIQNALQRELNKTGIGLKLVDPKAIRSAIAGLNQIGKILENNKRIQRNLNAFTKAHWVATWEIRKAQIAYNVELVKTEIVQRAINLDLLAAKAAWQGLLGVVRGAKDLFGNLLGGKAGKLGLAVGIAATSRAVEELAKLLNTRLNKAWLDNIRQAAKWASRTTEAVTAVTIAYNGLSGVIGGAQWVTGAVKGFIAWEDQAARSIWNITRETNKLTNILAAAAKFKFNPFAKGGAYDPQRYRKDDKAEALRGPSEMQSIQKSLAEQKAKLEGINTTSAEYEKIARKVLELEKQQTGELERRKAIMNKLGNIQEKQYRRQSIYRRQVERNLKASKAGRKGSGFAEWSQEVEKINAVDKAIRRKNKRIFDDSKKIRNLSKQQIKDEKELERAKAKAARTEAQKAKNAARTAKELAKQKKLQGQQLKENLMLGVGFPLLFGGGAGAIAGGTFGALTQSTFGKEGGFGAQILFSAAGTAIEQYIVRLSEVGQAFNSITPDTTALIDAMKLNGTEIGEQLRRYEDLHGSQKALVKVTEQMERTIGKDGVAALKKWGETSQEWSRMFGEAMLRIQASVAKFLNWANAGKSDGGLKGRAIQMGKDGVTPEIAAKYKEYSETPTRGHFIAKRANLLAELEELVKKHELLKANELVTENLDALVKSSLETTKAEIVSIKLKNKLGEREAGIQEKINEIIAETKKTREELGEERVREIEDGVRTLTNLQEQEQMWTSIKDIIKNELSQSIWELLEGTKSVEASLGNILRLMADMFMQKAIGLFIDSLGNPFRAEGGPVSRGGSYIVGERGPELFTPKKSGYIVPNNQLGGGSSTAVNVNVDASGSEVEGDEEKSKQLGLAISSAVQAEMVKQKMPGGLLYGGAYGR